MTHLNKILQILSNVDYRTKSKFGTSVGPFLEFQACIECISKVMGIWGAWVGYRKTLIKKGCLFFLIFIFCFLPCHVSENTWNKSLQAMFLYA